jgi:putative heme-binding domain-containing protein
MPASVLFHRPPGGAAPVAGLVGQFFHFNRDEGEFQDLSVSDYGDALLALASDVDRPADLRAAALSVAAARGEMLPERSVDFLIYSLAPSKPALVRATAAEALAKGAAQFNDDQLERIAAAVETAGPLELSKLLPAFERATSAKVGGRLLASLESSRAAGSLRAEAVAQAIQHFPEQVRRRAAQLLARLAPDTEKRMARLAELEPLLRDRSADVSRWRELFYGTRAACATCHTVAARGGRVGPDLSTIGAVRSGRDLLEAVVFPSASFARTFEPYLVKTKDGNVESGVITRETADAIHLVTGPGVEKRIARSAIEDVRQGTVSVMPEGLDTQLSRQELADLFAFLQSLK